jgi:hypothetical protein
MNLRASRLVAWMESEELTPEEAANDRDLPLAAVLQAIDYVKGHIELIAQERSREQQLLQDRGLVEAEPS